MISIVVTTYRNDTLRTRRCLEAILAWKRPQYELIVVVHNESALLRAYLRLLQDRGQVDRLLFAENDHGHVRGVNLGFSYAKGSIVLNINTDVVIGGDTVDRIVDMFATNARLGLVGWHYNWAPGHAGSFWNGNRLQHTVRTRENLARRLGHVDEEHMRNLRDSHWSSGRVIRAVGDRRILCLNTSFFAIRNKIWHMVGGFDETRYPHMWADDFLCYAVLDQGLDVANLPTDIRCSQRPDQFCSLSDLQWEGKATDPYAFVDRLSGDETTRQVDAKQEHFLSVIEDRVALGARAAVMGNPHLVPHRLRQYCQRRLGDSADYVFVGGMIPHHAINRVSDGGNLVQFSAAGSQVLNAPGPRKRFRRNQALPIYVASHTVADGQCS